MPAKVATVTVYAGDTVDWPTFVLTDNGVPRNFVAEGWADWTAQWRTTADAADYIALDVDDSAAAAGTINITATAEATRAMGGRGVWDLQATNSEDGTVRTWIYGATKYIGDVTRG